MNNLLNVLLENKVEVAELINELTNANNKLLLENIKLKNKIKSYNNSHYEFVTQIEFDGHKQDVELYKVTGLLNIYGYFKKGLPDMQQKIIDDEGNVKIIKTLKHLKVISLYKSLSKKLGEVYKKHNNKNNVIGCGKNIYGNILKSRSNSYPNTPYMRETVHSFMKKYPEEVWFNPQQLLDRDEEENMKKKEKHRRRVEKFLKTKEYIPRRIRNNKTISEDKKEKLIEKYYEVVKTCEKDLPKNKDMKTQFDMLRADLLKM